MTLQSRRRHRNNRTHITYCGREESTSAERAEGESERESSDKENDWQKKDVRNRLSDVGLIAGLAGQVPALVQALLLWYAVLTDFNTLLVRQTVFIQLAQRQHAARKTTNHFHNVCQKTKLPTFFTYSRQILTELHFFSLAHLQKKVQ